MFAPCRRRRRRRPPKGFFCWEHFPTLCAPLEARLEKKQRSQLELHAMAKEKQQSRHSAAGGGKVLWFFLGGDANSFSCLAAFLSHEMQREIVERKLFLWPRSCCFVMHRKKGEKVE